MNRLLSLILSGALLAGAAGCRNENAAAAPADPPPQVVSFVAITPEEVAVTGEWIATLDGNVNAQILPQVSGYLMRRVTASAFVRKGELLFEIDRRPFETALLQAQGHLAESQAQLAKADRDLARDRPLAEQRAIAQSQLDNDTSAHDSAQATLASAKAAVEAAQLNLSFTRVTSLIDGVAAIASAQIGDLVGPTTLLTTVSQLDPIKAYFPLSEQEYLGISGQVATPASTAKLWQSSGGLTLVLADGSTYPRRGVVLAVDREVDPKMGTIRISALFPNPGASCAPASTASGADRGPLEGAARAPRGVGAAERIPAPRHQPGQPRQRPHRHARACGIAGSSRRASSRRSRRRRRPHQGASVKRSRPPRRRHTTCPASSSAGPSSRS